MVIASGKNFQYNGRIHFSAHSFKNTFFFQFLFNLNEKYMKRKIIYMIIISPYFSNSKNLFLLVSFFFLKKNWCIYLLINNNCILLVIIKFDPN